MGLASLPLLEKSAIASIAESHTLACGFMRSSAFSPVLGRRSTPANPNREVYGSRLFDPGIQKQDKAGPKERAGWCTGGVGTGWAVLQVHLCSPPVGAVRPGCPVLEAPI